MNRQGIGSALLILAIGLASDVGAARGGGGGGFRGGGGGGFHGGGGGRGGVSRGGGAGFRGASVSHVAPSHMASVSTARATGVRTTGARMTGATTRAAGIRTTGVRTTGVTSRTAFASRQSRVNSAVRSNPRLSAAHRAAMRNPAATSRLRRDWGRFGWNRFGAWNAGLFWGFFLASPWFLFPFGYYDYYWSSYSPCLFYRFGYGFPCYWDYGYARDINLVSYVSDGRYDEALDKINERLDNLESELQGADESSMEDLKDQMEELKWYIADIKKYKQGEKSPAKESSMMEGQEE